MTAGLPASHQLPLVLDRGRAAEDDETPVPLGTGLDGCRAAGGSPVSLGTGARGGRAVPPETGLNNGRGARCCDSFVLL